MNDSPMSEIKEGKGFELKEFPEGFDLLNLVKELSDEIGYNSVIDLGCGHGRLAPSFDSKKYLGTDIDREILEVAKNRFSNYQFAPVDEAPRYADLYLAYSVFAGLSLEELDKVLSTIRCKWLIIGEVLGKEWRTETLPPVYSRDLAEYVKALRRHDFILQKHEKRPHKKYCDAPFFQGKNTDVSILVFKKCFKNPIT